ncbi:hypothetical protein GGI1_09978 [Acidithiobacillus sp. GGI-221]|nr:hypothetical protein GGI1_09978 [Acidithiobacillus sp. GGI-221]
MRSTNPDSGFYGIGYMLGLLANTDGGVDGYGGLSTLR